MAHENKKFLMLLALIDRNKPKAVKIGNPIFVAWVEWMNKW